MLASQAFIELGQALAGEYTVYIPDRRGRGMSGPHGDGYSVVRDVEDVRALVDETGAQALFGLSSGAIIALESALAVRAIRRVAAFEPPYRVGRFDPSAWAPRFERELSDGKLADAMLTVIGGTGGPAFLRLVPRFLLVPLVKHGLRANAERTKPGEIPFAELVPTMRYDARIVNETSRSLERMRTLGASTLLVGGSKSPVFLRSALDVLAALIPGAERLELRGVGHTAPCNEGKPSIVAAALRSFFAGQASRTAA
jgi:pimeloyl-ACP methyl ester carboxylesterase